MDEEISELVGSRDDASEKPGRSDTVSIARDDEGAPVVRLANSIIRHALSEGASDIYVEPRAEELVVRCRVEKGGHL